MYLYSQNVYFSELVSQNMEDDHLRTAGRTSYSIRSMSRTPRFVSYLMSNHAIFFTPSYHKPRLQVTYGKPSPKFASEQILPRLSSQIGDGPSSRHPAECGRDERHVRLGILAPSPLAPSPLSFLILSLED